MKKDFSAYQGFINNCIETSGINFVAGVPVEFFMFSRSLSETSCAWLSNLLCHIVKDTYEDFYFVEGRSHKWEKAKDNPEISGDMVGYHAWVEYGDMVYDLVHMFGAPREEYYKENEVYEVKHTNAKDVDDSLLTYGLESESSTDYFDKIRTYFLMSAVEHYLCYDKYIYGKTLRRIMFEYQMDEDFIEYKRCADEFFGFDVYEKIDNFQIPEIEEKYMNLISNKDGKFPGKLAYAQLCLFGFLGEHERVLGGIDYFAEHEISDEKIKSELIEFKKEHDKEEKESKESSSSGSGGMSSGTDE